MSQRRSRRFLVAVCATVSVGLAACGSDAAEPTTTLVPTTIAATVPTTAATVPTTSAPPTNSSKMRTVDTPAGAVEVPVSPQRIVLVDYYSLPDVLELGVVPIGVPEQLEDGLTAEQLATSASIHKVGMVSQLNLEEIAGLHPDLIIGVDSYNGDDYQALAAIAPTVLIPFASSGDWPQLAHTVADLVGKGAAMDALQATYERAVASLRADHAAALDATRWALISGGTTGTGAGTTYAWLANSTTGSIMVDAGFRLASASAGTSDYGFVELSYEELGQLGDADAIVTLAGADGKVADSSSDLVTQPLFQVLPAVQAGHVFPVVQMFPASFGQATLLVSELDAALAQLT